MGKRQPNTPRSAVKSALRRLWLRSRERQATLKRDGYCCQKCGLKQSRAKGKEVYVEVHHNKKGFDINWESVIELIYREILIDPSGLITFCQDCHDKEHKELNEKG